MGGEEFQHPFRVIRGAEPQKVIIGEDILCKRLGGKIQFPEPKPSVLEVEEKEDHNLPNGVESDFLDELKDMYKHDEGGAARVEPLRIALKGNADVDKIRAKPYRNYPSKEMAEVMSGMIGRKELEAKQGPICSPAFLVPKGNGRSRFVVDYGRVNTMTVGEGYPMPRIGDAIQGLGGSNWFTGFDLKNAFFALPVDNETGKISSIVTDKGRFLPKRLMMGLKQSSQLFQATMDNHFGDIKGLVCYVDDVAIANQSKEEHVEACKEFVSRCTRLNMPINWNKSSGLKNQIDFCGYTISGQDINARKHMQ